MRGSKIERKVLLLPAFTEFSSGLVISLSLLVRRSIRGTCDVVKLKEKVIINIKLMESKPQIKKVHNYTNTKTSKIFNDKGTKFSKKYKL